MLSLATNAPRMEHRRMDGLATSSNVVIEHVLQPSNRATVRNGEEGEQLFDLTQSQAATSRQPQAQVRTVICYKRFVQHKGIIPALRRCPASKHCLRVFEDIPSYSTCNLLKFTKFGHLISVPPFVYMQPTRGLRWEGKRCLRNWLWQLCHVSIS